MSASSPLDAILQRRSAAGLRAPGPTREQLALLLRAATTVPDHGMLQPYRFVIVEGEARTVFGAATAPSSTSSPPPPAGPACSTAARTSSSTTASPSTSSATPPPRSPAWAPTTPPPRRSALPPQNRDRPR